MESVLLVIHLIVTVSLIGVVLIQRSDGALGLSGSGGMGGVAGAQSTASVLTRATAILATIFIGMSLLLAILSSQKEEGLLEGTPAELSATVETDAATAEISVNADSIENEQTPDTPSVPLAE